MQTTPRKFTWGRLILILAALAFTSITFRSSLSLSTPQVEYNDKSGNSESYSGNFQDCQYDKYGPVKTVQESKGQEESTMALTCSWSRLITGISFASLGITGIFIISLCFEFCYRSTGLLTTTFLSGVAATGLLGATFILMEIDLLGSADPKDYNFDDFNVSFSKGIYTHHALLFCGTLVTVGILWLPVAKRFLKELERTEYRLPEDVPHIELAEAGSPEGESQSNSVVQ